MFDVCEMNLRVVSRFNGSDSSHCGVSVSLVEGPGNGSATLGCLMDRVLYVLITMTE